MASGTPSGTQKVARSTESAPPSQVLVRQRPAQPQPGGKSPSLSRASSSMLRAASHMGALSRKNSLLTNIKHGIKAMQSLRGAARELSRMQKHGSRPDGGSRNKGLKIIVGKPQKNWQSPAFEGARKGRSQSGASAQRSKSLSVMIGKPQKNWEAPEFSHHHQQSGGQKKSGQLSVMMGKPQKNWESAAFENGGAFSFHFRSPSSTKPGNHSRQVPRLSVMIGKPQKNWENPIFAREQGVKTSHGIYVAFEHQKTKSSSGVLRVGQVSIFLPGFEAAKEGRKKSYSLGAINQRQHAQSFAALPPLHAHSRQGARQRIGAPSPRQKHLAFSMHFDLRAKRIHFSSSSGAMPEKALHPRRHTI